MTILPYQSKLNLIINASNTRSYHPADMAREIGPCPPEALAFGLCADGLPLLLNMNDEVPGPVLVVADEFPRSFAVCVTMLAAYLNQNFSVSVVSTEPDSWEGFLDHRLCSFVAGEDTCSEQLVILRGWALANSARKYHNLLIVDGIQILQNADTEISQHFSWLMLRGMRYGIPMLVVADTKTVLRHPSLLTHFRTRVFGKISGHGEIFTFGANEICRELKPYEYVIREGEKWLKFVVPEVRAEE